MSSRSDQTVPALRLLGDRAVAAEVVEPALFFSNCRPEGPAAGRGGPAGEFLDIREITRNLYSFTGRWPKRIGNKLFVEGEAYTPRMLPKVRDLFAYFEGRRKVRWQTGPEAVTQEVFFAHLEATADPVTSIEAFPHEPRIPGVCYMHPPLPDATLGLIAQFLDFFCPATSEDRTLMTAALLTLFWGASLARPAFLFTSEEADRERGCGVGKSNFVDKVGSLVGGVIDVSPNDSIQSIKTRLLSGDGMGKRLARIDNVKSHKWSSGHLEGLFTTAEISGHRLYVGEGSRPNLLTWMITMNGPSVSKDFAQRMIPIQLARPVLRGTWEEEVTTFLRENGRAMIAEIIALLASPPPPMNVVGRQAAWYASILARAGGGPSTVALIVERQREIDADDDERATVDSYFRGEFGRIFGKSADQLDVFISSQQLTRLLGAATREVINVNQAKQRLTGLKIPEFTQHRVAQSRGVRWRGAHCTESSTPQELVDVSPETEPFRPRRVPQRRG